MKVADINCSYSKPTYSESFLKNDKFHLIFVQNSVYV